VVVEGSAREIPDVGVEGSATSARRVPSVIVEGSAREIPSVGVEGSAREGSVTVCGRRRFGEGGPGRER